MFIVNTNGPPCLRASRVSPQVHPTAGAGHQQAAQYITVHVVLDQLRAFCGSSEPWCSAACKSSRRTAPYSKLLCRLLAERLRISPDRVYINYYDMNASNVGWNNSTFA